MQVFAGPTSESLPATVASFHHRRRPRADSETEWSFYRPNGSEEELAFGDDNAVMSEDDLESSAQPKVQDSVSLRRNSLSAHGILEQDPLLVRRTSSCPEHHKSSRISQMVHVDSEDLTIVITGFETSRIGLFLYLSICVFSFGLGWLFFRWFPRQRVRLIGRQSGLGNCNWVIIEVQSTLVVFRLKLMACRISGKNLLFLPYTADSMANHCLQYSVKKRAHRPVILMMTMTTILIYKTFATSIIDIFASSIIRCVIDLCSTSNGKTLIGTA